MLSIAVFHFIHCIPQLQNFSVWFCFMISTSLLKFSFCLCIVFPILLSYLSVIGNWASFKQWFLILYWTEFIFPFFGVDYWKMIVFLWWSHVSWFFMFLEVLCCCLCIWRSLTSSNHCWLASSVHLIWIFYLFYFILFLHQQCPRSSPLDSWTSCLSTKACWSVGDCQSRSSLWQKAVENSYAAILMSLSHSVDHYC